MTESRITTPNLEDVYRAREITRTVTRVTPMLDDPRLDEWLGCPVSLKAEHLQRTGSFKLRGIYHRVARLTEKQRARGIVTMSSGNAAQALGSYGVRVKGQSKKEGVGVSGAEPVDVLPELPGTEHQACVGAMPDFCNDLSVQGFLVQFPPGSLAERWSAGKAQVSAVWCPQGNSNSKGMGAIA